MPGPVFPKPRVEVWRGMTQEELDLWKKKCERMLSVIGGTIQHDLGWPAPGEYEDRYRRLVESFERAIGEWENRND